MTGPLTPADLNNGELRRHIMLIFLIQNYFIKIGVIQNIFGTWNCLEGIQGYKRKSTSVSKRTS